jgi:hypothetical protein
LLLRRASGLPEDLMLDVEGKSVGVRAVDDTFYEPIPLSDQTQCLAEGVAVQSTGKQRHQWTRSRRALHIFSERPGFSGFASSPRVRIGQENVILCTEEIFANVLEICKATGADALAEVTGPGIESGWRCFRSYRPKHRADLPGADELLLALNPFPDAVIEFERGITTSRGVWIADWPPIIKIVGIEPNVGDVKIDGHCATYDGMGWIAPKWNDIGKHTVFYAGLSKQYEIVEPRNAWSSWPAHSRDQLYVCGAKISGFSGERAMLLPASPCWLLGAEPGQIAWVTAPKHGSTIPKPSFEPIWAILPRQGNRRQKPYLLSPDVGPSKNFPRLQPNAIKKWRRILLDAPARLDETAADLLWQQYKRAARPQIIRGVNSTGSPNFAKNSVGTYG